MNYINEEVNKGASCWRFMFLHGMVGAGDGRTGNRMQMDSGSPGGLLWWSITNMKATHIDERCR